MHWEKIPLQDRILYSDGKYERVNLIKEQLEEPNRQGIPYRVVRTKELDGTENLSIEKQVI
jgi:hypothetical protein